MKRSLFAILFLAAVASLNAASITYQISVNTSGIAGAPGYIEFQFNQVNALSSLAATATVGNFQSAGFVFFNAPDPSLGEVSGSLAAPPLVFGNASFASNLFDQGVTSFGSAFSFDLTLDGPALGTSADTGSEFFVYLLGTEYNGLVFETGEVAKVTINGDTSITAVPTELSTISQVPEPATIVTGLAGLALAFASRKLRRK